MEGIFLDSTRCSLVLVLSLFSSYNVIKLLFWFVTLADALNPRISRYILARYPLHLGFLEKLVLKFFASNSALIRGLFKIGSDKEIVLILRLFLSMRKFYSNYSVASSFDCHHSSFPTFAG